MTTSYHSNIDASWTLFLDRDGVINQKRDNDYVKTIEEFVFLPGAVQAIDALSHLFGRVVIVTNQQGIGKGLMTDDDLTDIHNHMLSQIEAHNGKIDKVYYCSELAHTNPACRKPNTGMALQAQADFPEIDFSKSVMVGDSDSDMEFGKRLGMHCVRIGNDDQREAYDALINYVLGISSQ